MLAFACVGRKAVGECERDERDECCVLYGGVLWRMFEFVAFVSD